MGVASHRQMHATAREICAALGIEPISIYRSSTYEGPIVSDIESKNAYWRYGFHPTKRKMHFKKLGDRRIEVARREFAARAARRCSADDDD